MTDATFEQEVLRSTLPVLIDLWAPWCGPCKAIAPIVEELAGEYEGRLKVMKLDVDGNGSTPVTYGVTSIPTLLLFKGGELVRADSRARCRSNASSTRFSNVVD